MSNMVKIKFITNHCCYDIGDVKEVIPGFAQIMIETGKAKLVKDAEKPSKRKSVTAPTKHKMVAKPEVEKEKRASFTG